MCNSIHNPLANIRIIGFGTNIENAIVQLRQLGFNSQTAKVYNPEQPPCLSDDIKMVILLLGVREEASIRIAESFKATGALTLAVCANDIKMPVGCIDSQTNAPISEMYAVTKLLLDPLISVALITLDVNDIDRALRNSGEFFLGEASGQIEDGIDDLMTDLMTKANMRKCQTFLLDIYNSPKTTQSLLRKVIEEFSNYIGQLPQNINVVWSASTDRMITEGRVRVQMIASPKPRE